MDEAERRPGGRSEPARDVSADAAAGLLEEAGVGLALLGADATVGWSNRPFALGCGRPSSEIEGHRLPEFLLAEDREGLEEAVAEAAADPAAGRTCAVRAIGADGRVHPLELVLGASGASDDDVPAAVLAVARDVSEYRRRDRRDRQDRIARTRAATVDPDSGMPNRRGLDMVLESAARHAQRSGLLFAALHCRVMAGAEPADGELVVACAARIRQRLRTADTVTRAEPDVLVVVAEDLGDEQDAAGVAYRVLSTVVEPVPTPSGERSLTMTVGVAVADGDTPPGDLLVAAAEAAAEAATSGPGEFRIRDLRNAAG